MTRSAISPRFATRTRLNDTERFQPRDVLPSQLVFDVGVGHVGVAQGAGLRRCHRRLLLRSEQLRKRSRDRRCLVGARRGMDLQLVDHKGILPCLRAERGTRLLLSIASALMSSGRVWAGSMTASR